MEPTGMCLVTTLANVSEHAHESEQALDVDAQRQRSTDIKAEHYPPTSTPSTHQLPSPPSYLHHNLTRLLNHLNHLYNEVLPCLDCSHLRLRHLRFRCADPRRERGRLLHELCRCNGLRRRLQ